MIRSAVQCCAARCSWSEPWSALFVSTPRAVCVRLVPTLSIGCFVFAAHALHIAVPVPVCLSVFVTSHMWFFPVDANPLDDGTYSQPQMFADSKMR